MNNLPNISQTDLDAIALRHSFRGEELYTELDEAKKAAVVRSTKTNKVVCLAEGENDFLVHTHGVELIGYKVTNRYKRGEIL